MQQKLPGRRLTVVGLFSRFWPSIAIAEDLDGHLGFLPFLTLKVGMECYHYIE